MQRLSRWSDLHAVLPIGALLLLCLAGPFAGATADEAVGEVADFVPPAERYSIERTAGGRLALGLGTRVHNGDRIRFLPGDRTAWVRIAYYAPGRADDRLTSDSPQAPIKAPSAPGFASNLRRMALDLVAHLMQSEPLEPDSATSKGFDVWTWAPLRLPLAAGDDPLRLGAGDGRVPLFWQGGLPPWSVVLTAPDGRVLATARSLVRPDWEIRIGDRAAYGPFDLEIADAFGARLRHRLLFEAPVPFVDHPDPLERVALLVGAAGGSWRCEAWRLLQTQPRSEAERVLRRALEEGR